MLTVKEKIMRIANRKSVISAVLIMFMFLLVMPFITNGRTHAANAMSVSQAEKRLVKKLRNYKRSSYPMNKYLHVSDWKKISKNVVKFWINVSMGDGAPEAGIVKVNLRTGKATLLEDYFRDDAWGDSDVGLQHGTYRI